ncbi:MAG: hypothetical protein RRB22_05755 [Gammaproteobacteria bacterium]|nr:hypothetical protein [Gammaproteobacteria bacterium]
MSRAQGCAGATQLKTPYRDKAERRLRYLRLQLSQYRRETIDFVSERQYQDKLLDKR